MNNKSEKISWKECFHATKRACGIWWKHYPKIISSVVLCAVIKALFPYVDIYLSARIINELAGNRNPVVLRDLVVITLAANLVLALLKSALERWKEFGKEGLWFQANKIYSDKFVEMDFGAADSAKAHELYNQIFSYVNWAGWGLPKVIECAETACQYLFQILGAILLTFSMFTMKIPAEAGRITVLNHPLFLLGMIALILGGTLLAPALANKANEFCTTFGDSTEANSVSTFYMISLLEKKCALDVRMYEQERIADKKINMDKTFAVDGPCAKAMRGKVGMMFVSSAGISYVMTGVIYLFVCLKAWGGAFGVGSVTQYVGATTALTQGISGLLSVLGELRLNAGFLKWTFELLDTPSSMYQGTLTVEKRNDRNYMIEFRDVSFKYPDSDAWSLRHVNMKFKVGEKLAIVGQNGSGKTTFIKLLCRLYDPTEGQILLNGIDIRKYNYKEYMSVFAVVFQDFALSSFRLGENIAVGRQVDEGRAEEKLLNAGFENWKEKMPKGLDTYLYKDFDEFGVDVSGGEAQKIAIARALYKDAPFIILDEPTAALDPIAEAEIYSKFNDIVEDKTAIYISHRLSSCKFCDEIAVFDAGSVIQQGSHENLVADESGKYYELWNAQAQYYA